VAVRAQQSQILSAIVVRDPVDVVELERKWLAEPVARVAADGALARHAKLADKPPLDLETAARVGAVLDEDFVVAIDALARRPQPLRRYDSSQAESLTRHAQRLVVTAAANQSEAQSVGHRAKGRAAGRGRHGSRPAGEG
jgi:hypothetical protein